MRTGKWLVAAITVGPAVAAMWAMAAQSRKDVATRRAALMKRLEKTIEQKWNVAPSEGMFMKIMVESTGAKRALEIGSSNGYGALWIGAGLEQTGGHLWTIEIDSARARECRRNIKEAGLDKVVSSIEGDAFDEIPKLPGPFDFVFIDAGKYDYDEFFELVFPKLEVGGVILAHNAIAYADAMKDYLKIVNNHGELDTVILSTTMKDGFAVSVRKKKEQ